MTLFKSPRRVVIRLLDGREIVLPEPPNAQLDPAADTAAPEIAPPTSNLTRRFRHG